MRTFALPEAIAGLVTARNQVRDYYRELLRQGGHEVSLKYTLDGNLVGDIGEALAVELFGITLVDSKSHPGIDGYSIDKRSVQIKATGSGYGPAFRPVEQRADHLIFFDLDFDRCRGTVFYNGPERPVVATLPADWKGQRMVSRKKLAELDANIADSDRLPFLH
ncbi:MAG: hypothetical protein K5905_19480 [Roseibium sp.]|uniref:DUF6998 domain-containing protein n=1 Tax=Roseibium sp. TaxID=1936156 RepID=UPI002612ED37|nr:hypothetical protein [Roseibium sp.]MCV0427642.1 hypothetical protein [Roseibium sp.]